MHLVEGLRARESGQIIIEHIYREYNANADSLANEALDNHDVTEHAGGVVINQNWF